MNEYRPVPGLVVRLEKSAVPVDHKLRETSTGDLVRSWVVYKAWLVLLINSLYMLKKGGWRDGWERKEVVGLSKEESSMGSSTELTSSSLSLSRFRPFLPLCPVKFHGS